MYNFSHAYHVTAIAVNVACAGHFFVNQFPFFFFFYFLAGFSSTVGVSW